MTVMLFSVAALASAPGRAEPVRIGEASYFLAPKGRDVAPPPAPHRTEAMRQRAETAEAAVAAKASRIAVLEESNAAEYRQWKADKAALESLATQAASERDRSLARQHRRIMRLTAALAGRKAQLARRGGELQFAHAKAAQLQRELNSARGLPSIILPGDTIAA